MYADDVLDYQALNDQQQVFQNFKQSTIAVCDWYCSNGMLLNASKSEAMIVGTATQLAKLAQPMTVSIAGEDIMCSNSMIYLGVLLDPHLSCDKFVSVTVSACNYHIRTLRHRKPVLGPVIVDVARAIVLTKLDYCNSILACTSESNLNKLQVIQNRLARLVVNALLRAHALPILFKVHWLPVRQRVQYKLSYNALSTGRPKYLSDLLIKYSPSLALQSSNQSKLVECRIKYVHKSHAFGHAAPKCWNELPIAVRNASSLSQFKRLLKTRLFRIAFA